MTRPSRSFIAPRFFIAALFAVGACDCDCNDEAMLGPPCTTAAECGPGVACVDGHCDLTGDGAQLDGSEHDANVMESLDSITISPSTVNLDLPIGTMDSSTTFTVTGNVTGGGTINIPNAAFSSDVQAPGVVDTTGRFFANGVIGGDVVVTAQVIAANGVRTASATIHITLSATAGGGDSSSPTSPIRRFTDNTPVTAASADAEILYPLGGAVMPQNVQPADVQWACDGAGAPCAAADMFRVRITKANLTITQYVTNDGNQGNGSVDDHFLVDIAAWRALAQTNPDDNATIVVDRWQNSMNRVVSGTPVTIRFAKAAITGTVYYWDIDDTTIRAIDDGTSTSRILLPHIDSPEAAGGGDNCVGCHSVSPTGRYMLANTNFDNNGALFDLTQANLSTANPTPYAAGFTAATDLEWRMSTWSPDEDRAVVSGADGNDDLRLINPFNGADVQAHNGAGGNINLPTDSSHPSWARDDSFVAYVSSINGWAGDTTTGNLSVLPVVDSAQDRFGTPVDRVLSSVLNGAAEVGAAPPNGNHGIFYPTWSPDSGYIAFAHGTSSRSDPRDSNGTWTAPPRAHTSALYLVNKNGGGRVRLSRGCAATQPEANPMMTPAAGDRTGLDYQPNFSPFQGGGYYWLSFLSRRPYGNRLSGNRSATAGYIQPGQIWIMAITVNPDGSVDPSEVAYWLPGQTPSHRAVSAYWAPRACRDNGEGCSVGSECCGGDCRPPVGGGAPVCAPPPPGMCRMIGQTCSDVADCCGAGVDPTVRCEANVCANIIE